MFTQVWWSVIRHLKMPSIAYVKGSTSIVAAKKQTRSHLADYVSTMKAAGAHPARIISLIMETNPT